MPSPRLIKFHGPYEPSLPRVIYLVRDARDVATSYYFFFKKNGLEISFQEYLHRFNRGTADQSFGSWNDHVQSWLNLTDLTSDDFLLIRYEDLISDTPVELSRMVKFIWGDVDHQRIETAIEATKIENLQNREKQSNWFAQSDTSINFFRKGVVGDWKNYFKPDMLKEFVLFNGLSLNQLGYLSSCEESEWVKNSILYLANSVMVQQGNDNDIGAQSYRYTKLQFEVAELHHTLEKQNTTLQTVRERMKKQKRQLRKLRQQLKQKNSTLKEYRTTLDSANSLQQVEINKFEDRKFGKMRSLWHQIKSGFRRGVE